MGGGGTKKCIVRGWGKKDRHFGPFHSVGPGMPWRVYGRRTVFLIAVRRPNPRLEIRNGTRQRQNYKIRGKKSEMGHIHTCLLRNDPTTFNTNVCKPI